ncbi:putative rRNA-processing protein EBP2 [Tubulanus polymorphus]|uniref:putative rRNA-processing protein EBP2 n=1 Tax=Tubulanus polymorphus TaxID=672921 RepID=UPI003DA24378
MAADMENFIDNSDASDVSDVDSDEELANAFQEGKLKPGVNVVLEGRKKYINDVVGMEEALGEFKQNLDWVETLDLTNPPAAVTLDTNLEDTEANPDDIVHNDFKRELLFYRQAQASVLEAIPRLKSLGILTKRPEDYFAQMAKTDDHMKKVREKLLSKEQALERSEKAKKLRNLRKYGKKVQTEVIQKRHKEKREMLDAVKKFRKGQKDKLDFLEGDKALMNKNTDPTPGKKREFKNQKYGFGGQKKRGKYNTATSAADMTEFNVRKHQTRPGLPKKRKQPSKNRPGKNKRQKMKSKKK